MKSSDDPHHHIARVGPVFFSVRFPSLSMQIAFLPGLAARHDMPCPASFAASWRAFCRDGRIFPRKSAKNHGTALAITFFGNKVFAGLPVHGT
jgi:hypothetical protein